MLQLGHRPLSPSTADQELFVGRSAELETTRRALSLGFNVYLQGDAGVGKTTLLQRLILELGERAELIQDIAHGSRNGKFAPSPGPVPEHWQDRLAYKLASESDPSADPLIFMLDDPGPAAIDELFGRGRDDLWELPVRFVVTGTGTLRPPADTFFETVVAIPQMTGPEIVELIKRRADTGAAKERTALRQLAPQLGQTLAPATPRQALAEARALLLNPEYSVQALSERLGTAKGISETAVQVLNLLTVIGGAYAGDDRLLDPTGLTRSRVVQVLKELEQASLVTSKREGKRVIYESVLVPPAGSK